MRASAVVAALVACVAIIPVWGQWPQGHLRVGGPTGSALCQRDEFCHLTKAEGVGCPGIINVRVFPMPPEMRRINDQEAYSDGLVCINMAEEYFSRCAGRKSATITTSLEPICSGMPKRRHGAKITDASPTANKHNAWRIWR